MIETDKIAEFINTAATEVFSTMLGLEMEAIPPRIESSAPSITDGVLSLIGLAGPWTGTGCISCSATFARQICASLLMTEAESINEEVLDAVGEVTNMIIGNFKTMAEEILGPLGLSIPTVIYGRNFTSRSLGHNDWVVVPLRCNGEILEIRVCLAPSKESPVTKGGFAHSSTVLA